MRYGIWNNKGGVGKTFLSFILGAEYANMFRDSRVILVDMCPQANLSEIALGGNGRGKENLSEILAKGKDRKTIGGYFNTRISSPHKIIGNETSFLLNLREYNENLTHNIYLICGDPSLEIQAQVISQIGGQTLPVDTWRNVHNLVNDLITSCSIHIGQERVIVLIDCNPSFFAYTELAMVACERLIIPCSSDGSSARAINNVAALLYGFNLAPEYEPVNFRTKANGFGIPMPLIHAVILNRSTQYNKKASKAFSAMFSAIKRGVFDFQEKEPSNFVNGRALFKEIPDSHSVSIVCSHNGFPLYHVKSGPHEVHETITQINKGPLDRYKEAVSNLLETI